MLSSKSTDETYAGQTIYNPVTLALYDIVVLGVSNRLIWRCPTPRILRLYNQHVTDITSTWALEPVGISTTAASPARGCGSGFSI
jgi:hypothetical protein